MNIKSHPLSWMYKTNLIVFISLIITASITGAGALPVSANAEPVLQNAAQVTVLPPPADLSCSELPDKRVFLTWKRVDRAAHYRLYRSLVQGTFTPDNLIFTFDVTSPYNDLSYYDGSVSTGLNTYYYVITSVNAEGLESVQSNEISCFPHYFIDWTGTVLPLGFTYNMGDPSIRELITGEIFIWGRTGESGVEPDVLAQFGYNLAGDDPASEVVDLTQWTDWQNAEYYGLGRWNNANSRYKVDFLPEKSGHYYYTFRFSTDNGRQWIYSDMHTNEIDPTSVPGNSLPIMVINNNAANTLPPGPSTLSVTNVTVTTINLTWTESTCPDCPPGSPDIYAYDLYRSTDPGALGQPVIRRLVGEPREFLDVGLVSGSHYYYRVVTLDTSFNSIQSNQVHAFTPDSLVTFSLNVTIPAFTPGLVYINREYDTAVTHQFGAVNWTGVPLNCNYAARLCTVELTIQENATLNFKFSRGSEKTIQTKFDGNSAAIDPSFTVVKGMTQVNRSIANWDDPLVVDYSPRGEGVSVYTGVAITWNQDMPSDTQFTLNDLGLNGLGPVVVVPGSFSYNPSNYILTFSPDHMLIPRRQYRVEVTDQPDLKVPAVIQQVDSIWSFTTGDFLVYLPLVRR